MQRQTSVCANELPGIYIRSIRTPVAGAQIVKVSRKIYNQTEDKFTHADLFMM